MFFKKFFQSPNNRYLSEVHSLQTPLKHAYAEIIKRRQNRELIAAVESYLCQDIPEHFVRDTPIFYLSRHVGTANYETLRFIQVGNAFNPNIPVVIGQDFEDLFVSNNVLKRALGKLPIDLNVPHARHQRIQYATIVDFSTEQGKRLSTVQTFCGTPLTTFHNELLGTVARGQFELVDESDWVTRNYRGSLLAHYKRLLALLIVHGIMFEDYIIEDEPFTREVLFPAFDAVTEHFGYRPLITYLVDLGEETTRDWTSYPREVFPLAEACRKSV
jgi:hypothetical protein